jgi:hypothetical protein
MEDVLNVYHRPPDPLRPLVCFDEASKQLVDHVQSPPFAVADRTETRSAADHRL